MDFLRIKILILSNCEYILFISCVNYFSDANADFSLWRAI